MKGAVREFTFIHWTDAHLCECDEQNKALLAAMAKRAEVFGGQPTQVAKDMVGEFNRLNPDMVAFTGDLVDVPTEANIKMGAEIFGSLDSFVCFAMGNHEWDGLAKPPAREHWWQRLQVMKPQPLDWYVQRMHGVNLLFVDDSDYQITDE